MTKDEALRLALEALERSVATCLDPYSHEQVMSRPEHFINQTITAIEAALEARDEFFHSVWDTLPSNKDVADAMRMKRLHQLSTPPQRTWVGLTDEEIFEIFGRIGTSNADINPYVLLNDARKIEAKLKEKNT